MGLSDFTDMGGLGVTIAGEPFDHRHQKCVAQVVQRFVGAQMVILAVRSDRFRELTRRGL